MTREHKDQSCKFHVIQSLLNQTGTLCTVLEKKFLYTELHGTPTLICLYGSNYNRYTRSLSATNKSVVTNVERNYLENYFSSITENRSGQSVLARNHDFDTLVKHFEDSSSAFKDLEHVFAMSTIAWIDGTPILLSKIDDGITLNFDAIYLEGVGFLAFVLWRGKKPESIPVQKNNELILVKKFENLPVHCISFQSKDPSAYITIEAGVMEVPFTYHCINFNGKKLNSNEEFRNEYQSNIPCFANIYRFIDSHYPSNYLYVCAELLVRSLEQNIKSSVECDLKCSYSYDSRTRQVFAQSVTRILHCDIKFNSIKDDRSSTLLLSLGDSNVTVQRDNILYSKAEDSKINKGLAYIYYEDDNTKDSYWIFVHKTSVTSDFTDEKYTASSSSFVDLKNKEVDSGATGFSNIETSEETKDMAVIYGTQSSCRVLEVKNSFVIANKSAASENFSSRSLDFESSDSLLSEKHGGKVARCVGDFSQVKQPLNVFESDPVYAKFLKHTLDTDQFPNLDILDPVELHYIIDKLNDSVPKESHYIQKLKGKLCYVQKLEKYFFLSKISGKLIILRCRASPFTVIYLDWLLSVHSEKKKKGYDKSVFADVALIHNYYIPVLIYEEIPKKVSINEDLYYYNTEGIYKGIDSTDGNILLDILMDDTITSISAFLRTWEHFTDDPIGQSSMNLNCKVILHLKKSVLPHETWQILLMIPLPVDNSTTVGTSVFRNNTEMDHLKENPETQIVDTLQEKGSQDSFFMKNHTATISQRHDGQIILETQLPDGSIFTGNLKKSQLFYSNGKWINSNCIPLYFHCYFDGLWIKSVLSVLVVWIGCVTGKPQKQLYESDIKYFEIPGIIISAEHGFLNLKIFINSAVEYLKTSSSVSIFDPIGNLLLPKYKEAVFLENSAIAIYLDKVAHGYEVHLISLCSDLDKSKVFYIFSVASQRDLPSTSLSADINKTIKANTENKTNSTVSIPKQTGIKAVENITGAAGASIKNKGTMGTDSVKGLGTSIKSDPDATKEIWKTLKYYNCFVVYEGKTAVILSATKLYFLLLKKDFCPPDLKPKLTTASAASIFTQREVCCNVLKLACPITLKSVTVAHWALVAYHSKKSVEVQERVAAVALSNYSYYWTNPNVACHNLKTVLRADIKPVDGMFPCDPKNKYKPSENNAVPDKGGAGTQVKPLTMSAVQERSEIEIPSAVKNTVYKNLLNFAGRIVFISGTGGIIEIKANTTYPSGNHCYFNHHVIYNGEICCSNFSSTAFEHLMNVCMTNKTTVNGHFYECQEETVFNFKVSLCAVLLWFKKKPANYSYVLLKPPGTTLHNVQKKNNKKKKAKKKIISGKPIQDVSLCQSSSKIDTKPLKSIQKSCSTTGNIAGRATVCFQEQTARIGPTLQVSQVLSVRPKNAVLPHTS